MPDSKEQFENILNSLNIKDSEFARKIGLRSGTFSNLKTGKRKPSYEVTLKIKEAYPTLNLNWFFTGEGEMWLEDSEFGLAQKTGDVRALSNQLEFKDRENTMLKTYIEDLQAKNQKALDENTKAIQRLNTMIEELKKK